MTEPTISTVIPAFNSEVHLPRALRSVLAQTSPVQEIIIVDDGSKVPVSVSLDEEGPELRIVTQHNQGPAAARNLGVSIATGDYIAFLDSDDAWHPRKIEIQRSALSKHPELDLCFTDWRTVTDPALVEASFSTELGDCEVELFDDFIRIFRWPYLGTPGVLIRRSLFLEEEGFDTSFKRAEDVEFWLRVAWGRQVARIHSELFTVVNRPDSASTIESHSDNLRAIEKFCADHPDFSSRHPSEVRRVKSRVHTWWGRELMMNGDVRSAIFQLRKAIRLSPNNWAAWYLLGKYTVRNVLARPAGGQT